MKQVKQEGPLPAIKLIPLGEQFTKHLTPEALKVYSTPIYNTVHRYQDENGVDKEDEVAFIGCLVNKVNGKVPPEWIKNFAGHFNWLVKYNRIHIGTISEAMMMEHEDNKIMLLVYPLKNRDSLTDSSTYFKEGEIPEHWEIFDTYFPQEKITISQEVDPQNLKDLKDGDQWIVPLNAKGAWEGMDGQVASCTIRKGKMKKPDFAPPEPEIIQIDWEFRVMVLL